MVPLASFALATLLAAVPAFADTDTDGDGIPDSVEAAVGLNPSVKDNNVGYSPRLFAMQQYRDFLGREGDSGGVTFYHDAIVAGTMLRTQVIENFLASPEFQDGLPQVTRLYFSFFNRIPDFGGLQFQVAAFRAGTPLEVIAQNFYNSPEFTSRYGALSNDDYINLVYQNVLGRAPDAGGFQFYKNLLDNNTITKGQMMIGFSESPEFQQLMADEVYVTAVYVGMLRRAPDAGGLQFYVDQIGSGVPRNGIIIGFMNSPEYHDRFMPPPQASNLVATQQMLGGTWTFQFNNGTPLTATYTITGVDPVNSSGDYPALGTDSTGDQVITGYLGARGQWGLFDPQPTVDRVFIFTFMGANSVAGCYYELPSGSNSEDFGTCYPMTGTRS